MVKLKQITKEEGTIRCVAYVEDCAEPIPLTLNLESRELDNYTLPTGYEWCWSHIAHAKRNLLKMVDDNCLQEEILIMWY